MIMNELITMISVMIKTINIQVKTFKVSRKWLIMIFKIMIKKLMNRVNNSCKIRKKIYFLKKRAIKIILLLIISLKIK